MGRNIAPEHPAAATGETNVFAVDFSGALDSGELLTGTPTVAEVTSSDLTITSKSINTGALTINSRSVAVGLAVQFKVVGQVVSGSPYKIKITVSTDSSPAQTKVKWIRFVVEDE